MFKININIIHLKIPVRLKYILQILKNVNENITCYRRNNRSLKKDHVVKYIYDIYKFYSIERLVMQLKYLKSFGFIEKMNNDYIILSKNKLKSKSYKVIDYKPQLKEYQTEIIKILYGKVKKMSIINQNYIAKILNISQSVVSRACKDEIKHYCYLKKNEAKNLIEAKRILNFYKKIEAGRYIIKRIKNKFLILRLAGSYIGNEDKILNKDSVQNLVTIIDKSKPNNFTDYYVISSKK